MPDAIGVGPDKLTEAGQAPPLQRLPFVRIAYTVDVAPDTEMAEPRGGSIEVVHEYTLDEIGQLVGSRLYRFTTNGDEPPVSMALDRFVCDQDERRRIRNHIHRPTITEDD